ncbi:hypothetical protein [Rhodomicrobium lacus]|jgi:hypothetical protein|uniref:hypothetical protein n=1 Tax=Rhodomicrobium TaxID=1068 RepID=UPI000F8DB8C0|nr:hypothetical protein [Rhodomicrobium lacus]WKW49920.1 hypothetical protein QMO75_11500 [Rhodomicrobium lacus]
MRNNTPSYIVLAEYLVEDEYSRISAVKLARLLSFAMADFEQLGMADWNEKIEECIRALMLRYKLSPEELFRDARDSLQ